MSQVSQSPYTGVMRGLATKYICSCLSNSLIRQCAEMSQMSEAPPLYTIVNILQSSVDMFQSTPHFVDKLQYIISSTTSNSLYSLPIDLIQTFRFSSHKPTDPMHSFQYYIYGQVHFKGYSIKQVSDWLIINSTVC